MAYSAAQIADLKKSMLDGTAKITSQYEFVPGGDNSDQNVEKFYATTPSGFTLEAMPQGGGGFAFDLPNEKGGWNNTGYFNVDATGKPIVSDPSSFLAPRHVTPSGGGGLLGDITSGLSDFASSDIGKAALVAAAISAGIPPEIATEMGTGELAAASALDVAGADITTGAMAGVAPSAGAAATAASLGDLGNAVQATIQEQVPEASLSQTVASPVTQGAVQETALPSLENIVTPNNAINAGTGFVDPAVAAGASTAIGGDATLANIAAAAPAAATATSPYALSTEGTRAGLGATGTLAAANAADPYALTAATTGSANVLEGNLTARGLSGIDAMGGAAGLTAAGAAGSGIMNAVGSSSGLSDASNAFIGTGIGTSLGTLSTGINSGGSNFGTIGTPSSSNTNSNTVPAEVAAQFPWLQGMLGLYDMYNRQNAAQTLRDQFNTVNSQINGMYAEGSPELALMKQELDRKDAAAGRNSQYGVRATDLAGKIASTKGNLLAQTLGSQNNLLAASLATGNSSIGSLANLFGQTAGSNGAGVAGNAVSNSVNSAINSGVNGAINWGRQTLGGMFGSLGDF